MRHVLAHGGFDEVKRIVLDNWNRNSPETAAFPDEAGPLAAIDREQLLRIGDMCLETYAIVGFVSNDVMPFDAAKSRFEALEQKMANEVADNPALDNLIDTNQQDVYEGALRAIQAENMSSKRSAANNEKGSVIQMPEQAAQQDGTRAGYAHVTMPNAFVRPYTYTAKDGRTFEKAYVHFAQGTKVNGIDVGGFSCDVFMSDRMKQQMLSAEPVTLSFKADEPVPIWKGSKDDPEHPYQRFEVNPWALVKGVKAEFEGFKADRAAEREAAKEQGVSLKGMEQDSRASAEALAGRDAQDDRLPETR